MILLVVVVFAFQFCAGGGFDIPGSPDLGGADQAPAGDSGPDLGERSRSARTRWSTTSR